MNRNRRSSTRISLRHQGMHQAMKEWNGMEWNQESGI